MGSTGGFPVEQLEGVPAPSTKPHHSWTITKMASTGTIVLRFVGFTPTHEIPEFFAALTEMMPEENAKVVFDLRELLQHNPDTKEYAKRWLVENKARLGEVIVVVTKVATILKMATAVVSLAAGYKVRLRDDLDFGTPIKL